ncbi:AAA family ATPase [Vibrio cholerae]|nr:AAA family ATPase [Vibrio cholerae]EEY49052.1 hypothetical protein VIG_001034 [Vibrio cholerae INDRE 91/1]AFC58273.1 hypothetical protein O3Y_06975 [Vibrio cholerae IEC224]AUR71196.1 ATP-binding protein [Vibrio cholerae]AVL22654.1 hypothetical protein VCA1552_01231 [Vibrio cholerae]AWB73975.1 hypothetical protein A1552VC_01233 [Vibrio cholerae]
MAETLKVKNFLVIKNAEIDIKRINIIIGPQANGKSLLAKLVYFFQCISKGVFDCVRLDQTKYQFDKLILSNFEQRFPRYSWENTSFIIEYTFNDLKFTISGVKKTNGKTSLKIRYSDILTKSINNKKKLFKKKFEEASANERKVYPAYDIKSMIMYESIADSLKNDLKNTFYHDAVFIPASRTFFANLQKNIFTFLASNLDIDPYLKEFGSLYENAKRLYNDPYLKRRNVERVIQEVQADLQAVVNGDYEYIDEQDWIVNKGKRINLINASSGQQESLPMLLVLATWTAVKENCMFFIEEPEAHLFPTSQGRIVSILSKIYSETNSRFFLTSHSPYILSAFNNFIMAKDVIDNGNFTLKRFVEVNGSGSPINFDDVSAYTIVDGNTKCISDTEYRMVGADILDNISDHFQNVMNVMLSEEF